MCFDFGDEVRLAGHANDFFNAFAVFEDNHGRDSADVKFGSEFGVGVDINFTDLNLAV